MPMSTRSRARTTLRFCCCLAAFAVPALDPVNLMHPGGSPALAGDASVEKEAFEAAKDLGTVEAWDAFLSNYPTGFHADLDSVDRLHRHKPRRTPGDADQPTAHAIGETPMTSSWKQASNGQNDA